MSERKENRETKRPNIFRYHHYRLFLSSWFDYLKSTKARFSLRSLAQKSGLSSAYLPYVLAGKRKLSARGLTRIAPHLELNRQEREYLELLREISESDTLEARLEAMEKILSFRDYKDLNPKETEVFRYLTRWFNVAIREMAALPDFKAEPNWIHRRLGGKVSHYQIKQSLELLQKYGFLEKTPSGKVKPPSKRIACEGEVFGLALRQFNKEINSVLFDSLDQSSPEEHIVGGHTFAIPTNLFPKVREILEEALRKVEKLEHGSKKADAVYHISLLSAPITKPSGQDS